MGLEGAVMKYTGIVLMTDLDGSLLDSQLQISKENREAIEYFIKEGGRFGIATGRGPENAKVILGTLPINFPSIFYNGCIIYDWNIEEVLMEKSIAGQGMIRFLEYAIKNHPQVDILVYTRLGCSLVSPLTNEADGFIAMHHPLEKKPLSYIEGHSVIKILFKGNDADLLALDHYFTQNQWDQEAKLIKSWDDFMECIPQDVSKGSMLNELKKQVSSDSLIYAVGDYDNDLEMIQEAHVGIATENALDGIKSVADYITLNHNNSAIAHVIYEIIGKL